MPFQRLLHRASNRPTCCKRHSLRRWVERRLGSVEHEDRVLQIAERLVDLTWSMHELTASNRRMLAMAAIVHDVGRSVDDDTHPQQGARMLLDSRHDLPIGGRERRMLAYLTRYHRGKAPAEGHDGILRRDDDHASMRLILAFLRAADALDNRSMASPRLVFQMQGRRLRVICYVNEDAAKARRIYRRRKKFRLLEQLLECRVEVDVRVVEELQRVA